MNDWTNPLKWFVDGVSAAAIVGALIGALPAIAALVGVVYYIIQIYESPTFQKRWGRWRVARHRRRVGRLMKNREKINAALSDLGPVKDPK